MAKPRLVYAWPTAGYPKPAFVNALSAIRMGQTLTEHGARDLMAATGPVNMSRTTLCGEAIRGNFDYMVMHDDDLALGNCGAGSPIDNSIRIMESDPSVAVVGVVYLRENPEVPTLNMYHPEYGVREHCGVIGGLPAQPFEVGGIGFGWVMIRVSVIKQLNDHNDGPVVRFGTREDIGGNRIEVGEDFDFCDRVHQLGYKVIADPRYITEHYKMTGIKRYQHEEYESRVTDTVNPMKIQAPAGAKLTRINGLTCLDLSATRLLEQAEREKAKAA